METEQKLEPRLSSTPSPEASQSQPPATIDASPEGPHIEESVSTTGLSKNPLLQKQLIEAALYVSGRPLDMKTLGNVIGARSEDKIRAIVQSIMEKYRQMESPLQIVELQDGRWVMQLKGEISKYVRRLSSRPLVTPGPLRTLGYIALNQPVTQARVVLVRGKLAYGHVKQLREMDLITDEKVGKTRILRTTRTFADYFNLSQDQSEM
ncbi:MAG TPA: SMC-Scp complex subunit ScpB, partial [Candidatus Binatus sp.]|nr:SMC-Scp complex subunit ScpB [Candidatus Binatus sp.]